MGKKFLSPHYLSRTTNVMIVIFRMLMKNNISRYFFHFTETGFFVQKMARNRPKASLHYIWGVRHFMIVIFGTLIQCNIISIWCFFHFSEILIFHAKNGVKVQKIAQNIELFYTVFVWIFLKSWRKISNYKH